jgi:hypothetical protein
MGSKGRSATADAVFDVAAAVMSQAMAGRDRDVSIRVSSARGPAACTEACCSAPTTR